MKKINYLLLLIIAICFTGCMGLPPEGFVQQPAGWTRVPVSSHVTQKKAWSVLVDELSDTYDFATMDSESGYAKTTWHDEGTVKTRITAKLNGHTLKIKVESQFFNDLSSKWVQGTNTNTTKDIKDNLSGRLN